MVSPWEPIVGAQQFCYPGSNNCSSLGPNYQCVNNRCQPVGRYRFLGETCELPNDFCFTEGSGPPRLYCEYHLGSRRCISKGRCGQDCDYASSKKCRQGLECPDEGGVCFADPVGLSGRCDLDGHWPVPCRKCSSGLFCDDGRCKQLSREGEDCGLRRKCETGLKCTGCHLGGWAFRCISAPGQMTIGVGEACSTSFPRCVCGSVCYQNICGY